ncbi:MFS transporter [Brevirhabdus sp.]|uniref:MFS transporter n=1 Tax=Brevirhabdus sp. TaxID=2004514 RepID=UPI004058CF68
MSLHDTPSAPRSGSEPGPEPEPAPRAPPAAALGSALRLSRATLPAFAAEGVVYGAFAAYVPQIKAGLAAGDAEFSVALLVSAAAAVGAMLVAPGFADRAGRHAMALAAVLMAAACVLPMAAGTLMGFTLLMALLGGTSGLLDIVMNARVSVIEGRARRSIMNLNHAGFSAAYAIAAILSGLARAQGVGPLAVFAVIALLLIAAAPLMTEREPPPAPKPALDTAAAADLGSGLGRSRLPVVLAGLIVFAAFLAENATEGWSALHIERTLGGAAAEGALGPAMLGLTMLVGRLSGQIAAARLSESAVIRGGALLGALGALGAALAPGPPLAYAGFAVLGLGISVIVPMALALVGGRVAENARALAISRTAVIGYFGFFIGPPMMGLVSEWLGLRASFIGVALIVMAIVPLAILLRRV